MRNDRNEEIPAAIGEADRRCMCHEQNKLISTAIDEGEEPESVAVGTQSDHCQHTVLQSLNDIVNFNLFISLSKAYSVSRGWCFIEMLSQTMLRDVLPVILYSMLFAFGGCDDFI